MAQSVELKCNCSKIIAKIKDISPSNSNHLTCYCKSCQSFIHALSPSIDVLNSAGGTQIVQVPLSHFEIIQGKEYLACLKLSSKGLIRWYCNRCNTPIGNTVNANWPFIGIINEFIHDDELIRKVGPIQGAVHTQHATSTLTKQQKGHKSHLRLVLRTIRKLIKWKIIGKNSPSCLFDDEGQPIVKPKIAVDKNTAH